MPAYDRAAVLALDMRTCVGYMRIILYGSTSGLSTNGHQPVAGVPLPGGAHRGSQDIGSAAQHGSTDVTSAG